jgi:addiction module HigA family antidote
MANEEKYLRPIHPGEILASEFLFPLGISQNKLARAIGVPPRRINEIVHGKRAVSADTALRLSRSFGTSAQFWLNLQTRYELDCIIHAERTGNTGCFDFIEVLMPAASPPAFAR